MKIKDLKSENHKLKWIFFNKKPSCYIILIFTIKLLLFSNEFGW